MPSTYSPRLRLELVGAGEQSGLWGDTTNKNFGTLVEQAIAGVAIIPLVSPGVYIVEALDGTSDEARCAVLNFTGSPGGAVTAQIPSTTKLYVVRNDTNQTLTVKTSAQVANPLLGGVPLLPSEATLVFCNGTSAVKGIQAEGVGVLGVAGGGTGEDNFAVAGFLKTPGGQGGFTSSATVNLATEVSGVLPAVNGGTGGLLPTTAGGTGTNLAPSAGQVLIGTNSGTYTPAFLNQGTGIVITPSSGGITISASGATGGVTSISGSNIGVSQPTGSVLISLNSTNVTSALGYTPVSSSALSGYAELSANSNWTGAQTALGGSLGDQRWKVTFGGYTGGISSTSLQLGNSGIGMVYDPSNGGLSMGVIFGVNITCFPSYLYVNTDNTQRPTGGPWVSPSDERLKENIQTYTKGLSAIAALRPVTYTLKGELGEATKHKVCTGLVAQEVLDTPLSSMIGTNPDGFYSLDANEVTWALVNAVKELKAELDEAKAEIAALKAK